MLESLVYNVVPNIRCSYLEQSYGHWILTIYPIADLYFGSSAVVLQSAFNKSSGFLNVKLLVQTPNADDYIEFYKEPK